MGAPAKDQGLIPIYFGYLFITLRIELGKQTAGFTVGSNQAKQDVVNYV